MLEVEYFQNIQLAHDVGVDNISLPDGTSVTVRSVREDDAGLIMEMHNRLSVESLYYRYLGANKPTIEHFQHLCSSNRKVGKAIVATIDNPHEKVIALAYYCIDPDDPSKAEPAVLVEDSFQRCGLGKRIVISLYQMAVQEGLTSFDIFIHPENYRVLQMIKSSGLQFECKYKDGMKEIRIEL